MPPLPVRTRHHFLSEFDSTSCDGDVTEAESDFWLNRVQMHIWPEFHFKKWCAAICESVKIT